MASKKKVKAVLPRATAATFEKVKRNVANQRQAATLKERKMQNPSEQIEKMNRDLTTRIEEVANFNRNNLDAAVQAANCLAEGVKDVNQAIFNHIQQTLQMAMTTGKAMMGVKTLRDLMELQSEYVKSTFDTLMADTTKISEIAVRCSSEAVEPINARVTEVVEKVSSRAKNAA